jgi:hypothetical protein
VSLDALALTGQGDVDEVFITLQAAQRRHDVRLANGFYKAFYVVAFAPLL